MTLTIALVAVLAIALAAAGSRLPAAAAAAARRRGRLHSPARLSWLLRRACGRRAGLAVPRRLGAGADGAGRSARCSPSRRAGAARLRNAARRDPRRGARDCRAASAAGFNPESTALAPIYAAGQHAITQRSAAPSPSCSPWPAASSPCAGSSSTSAPARGVERWVMVAAGRRLADRDPDDARHRPVAAVRIACASSAGPPDSNSCSAPTWSPQTAIRADQAGSSGAFGAVPLFWGTVVHRRDHRHDRRHPARPDERDLPHPICAPQRLRAWLKPILEILAGVPTVVYGYFAALTVAPMVRDFGLSIGISSAISESALAAGLVMGIMIIPFVSSMADDSIAAVPQAMRDGSLALGATKSETITQGRAARRAAGRRRRRPARGQPRDRRDDDRGDGRRASPPTSPPIRSPA